MPEDQSRQLEQGNDDCFQPPDLRPLRELAEREELADARACLGNPLPADGRYAPLARDVAEALTARFLSGGHAGSFVQRKPMMPLAVSRVTVLLDDAWTAR